AGQIRTGHKPEDRESARPDRAADLARRGRRGHRMRRRTLIAGIGGVAMAWPFAARAQQKPMPVIGFLGVASPGPFAPYVAAFHQGLSDTGYVEGQNVSVEYRWAEGHYD